MDEILFETSHTPTLKDTVELHRILHGARRYVFILLFSLLNLAYAWYAYLEFYWHSIGFYTFMFAFCLCFTVYLFFQPRITAGITLRRAAKFYDGNLPEYHYFFTETEILAQTERQQFQIPYDKLDKIRIAKNLIILTAKKYARVSVHKDSFTKGTYEEFLAFLRDKRPDLKIPE